MTDSVKDIVGGEGKPPVFKICGAGTFKHISAEDDKAASEEIDNNAVKSGKVGWRDYGHGDVFNTDDITLGAVVYQKDNEEIFGFCIKLELYSESRKNIKYIERLEKINEKITKEKNGLLWEKLDCENQGTFAEKTIWAIKYNVGLFENGKSKDFDDIIDEMTKGVFILKAFYKYLVSGNNDILENKIPVYIKSLACAQEAGIALGPTLITLDDLIFDDNKQIVLTGAPGTGKTFSAQEYVMWQALTEWKKDNNAEDSKKFIKYWKETIPTEPNKAEADSDSDSKLKKYISDYKRDRFHLVQFHPSYDYTDFVEGLRPIDGGKGNMKFVKMDGEFKSFCRTAADPNKKNKKFYFVIDEINRADLSKVFGELMYCLEEDYRGPGHTIKTQYSNLQTYKFENDDVFANGDFYIPENVIIIGTMNDIDRSVDTFDFALRRRFRWIKVDVDDVLLNTTFRSMNKNSDNKIEQISIDDYVSRIVCMNEQVIESEDYRMIFRTPKDYFVGPAYFKGLFKGDSMENIWKNKVEPLLKEYVRGRDETEEFIGKCKNALLQSQKVSSKEVDEEQIESLSLYEDLDEDGKSKLKKLITKLNDYCCSDKNSNLKVNKKGQSVFECLLEKFEGITDNDFKDKDKLYNKLELKTTANNLDKKDKFQKDIVSIISEVITATV